MYRTLDQELIENTVEQLHSGLVRHFPGSGLSRVVAEVLEVAGDLEQRARWIAPSLSFALRSSVGVAVFAIIASLVWMGPMVTGLAAVRSLAEFLEAAESGLQLVLLLGAAVFFLVSAERRIVRRNVLIAIAELRSLVHVVDMHQLRKGPEHLRTRGTDGVVGASISGEAAELIRYLDYCSETLAMLSKMSAFYVQRVQDADVVGTAQGVQVVTIGLSQKIWQKIAILDRMLGSPEKPSHGADGDYGAGAASS